MKNKLVLSILAIILCHQMTQAQNNRYIIRLKDKQFNTYSTTNPGAFLTQRALNRRTQYNIPIDSTDLPVTARYLDSIRLSGAVNILNTSRWLNQVAISTNDAAALARINSFPFVLSSAPIGNRSSGRTGAASRHLEIERSNARAATPSTPNNLTGFYNYGLASGQIKLSKGDFLHNHGFRGQGMQMAMLDAGFYHYQTLPSFDSANANN
ncbi:MAG: hypothetical protein EOO88_51950, partial [Pedobacter sp.]